MKHLQRLFVGIPISAFLTLFLLGAFSSPGGMASAQQLIFYAVVCTLGMSVLLWLVVAYIVGALALGTVSIFSGEQPGAKAAPDVLASLSTFRRREVMSVADFFRQAHAAGRSDEQITALLGEVGWTAEDIRLGRLAADLEPSQAATT